MFTYYPYFWGRKDHWMSRVTIDDRDPQFAEFLKAGAARVVLSVRKAFENAVLHFMETGEIWEGSELPNVSSDAYVSLLVELQEREGLPQDGETSTATGGVSGCRARLLQSCERRRRCSGVEVDRRLNGASDSSVASSIFERAGGFRQAEALALGGRATPQGVEGARVGRPVVEGREGPSRRFKTNTICEARNYCVQTRSRRSMTC